MYSTWVGIIDPNIFNVNSPGYARTVREDIDGYWVHISNKLTLY
jgi:hypothetical protein